MTCNLNRPDPQTLFDQHKKMFENTILGGAQVIPESNEWYAIAVNYAAAEEMFAVLAQSFNELDPAEACCDNLYSMAARDGVFPFPATFSQGYIKLTGVAGTPLPATLEFLVDGQTYVTATDTSAPTQIDENGQAVTRVRALVPGVEGNISVTNGTLVTAVADVEGNVEICGGSFCQGAEAEPCESFRARYIARKQYQPRATQAWIQQKLLEWPCATRAIARAGSCCSCSDNKIEGCSGCAECGNALDFYVMFDGTFECGIAPDNIIAEIDNWMFGEIQGYGMGQLPVGVCGSIRPVTPLQVVVRVELDGCPTAAQIQDIETQVAEFMGTLSPSLPLNTSQIVSIVNEVLEYNIEPDVFVELVNPEEGYGPATASLQQTDEALAFITDCAVEPECDVMVCLSDIIIDRTAVIGDANC